MVKRVDPQRLELSRQVVEKMQSVRPVGQASRYGAVVQTAVGAPCGTYNVLMIMHSTAIVHYHSGQIFQYEIILNTHRILKI